MAADNPLLAALLGGQGDQNFTGYDPRQAGPPPDPRYADRRPGPPPEIFTPNPQQGGPPPAGNGIGGWWNSIKRAMPWDRLSQPGYGGQPGSGGSGPSPWGGS